MLLDEYPIVERNHNPSKAAVVAAGDLVVVVEHVDFVPPEMDFGDAHLHGMLLRLTGGCSAFGFSPMREKRSEVTDASAERWALGAQ